MKTASAAKIAAQFNDYLDASRTQPVLITRNGKPVAVRLGVDDEDELERLVLAYSPKLQTILNAARERVRSGAGVAHEDFWRDLDPA